MSAVTDQEFGPKVSDVFSQAEIEALKAEMVSSSEAVPVRFLLNGRNLNISSGHLMSKGVNVIHQTVYWNFSRETAKKIAARLKVQAVFSQ